MICRGLDNEMNRVVALGYLQCKCRKEPYGKLSVIIISLCVFCSERVFTDMQNPKVVGSQK